MNISSRNPIEGLGTVTRPQTTKAEQGAKAFRDQYSPSKEVFIGNILDNEYIEKEDVFNFIQDMTRHLGIQLMGIDEMKRKNSSRFVFLVAKSKADAKKVVDTCNGETFYGRRLRVRRCFGVLTFICLFEGFHLICFISYGRTGKLRGEGQ